MKPAGENVVEVEDLHFAYNARSVFRGLSLKVPRGKVVAIDTADCLVRAGEGKRVALVGVSDLIVVADGDDVLILPRGRSQDVKRIIEAMKK